MQPTAREVVHHVLVFAGPKGARLNENGFFAVYVPGNNVLMYPDGYAKKLPKGATLHFQIHYTPNGKATTDQTKLGIVFAKEAPRYEIHVAGIANTRFQIPAGDDNYKVTAAIPVSGMMFLLKTGCCPSLERKSPRWMSLSFRILGSY